MPRDDANPYLSPAESPHSAQLRLPRITLKRAFVGFSLATFYLFPLVLLSNPHDPINAPYILSEVLGRPVLFPPYPVPAWRIGLAVAFWLLVGVTASIRRTPWPLLALLAAHYVGAVAALMHVSDWKSLEILFRESVGVSLIWCVFYVAGQVILWYQVVRMFREHQSGR